MDYRGWGFTREEAKILVHEARLIEQGDYVWASREEYLTGLLMGIWFCRLVVLCWVGVGV